MSTYVVLTGILPIFECPYADIFLLVTGFVSPILKMPTSVAIKNDHSETVAQHSTTVSAENPVKRLHVTDNLIKRIAIGGFSMFIKTQLTLVKVMDQNEFDAIFKCADVTQDDSDDEIYNDKSLFDKGILIRYRDSQYKKKMTLIIDPNTTVDDDEVDPHKLIRKLNKRIMKYSGERYNIDDFKLKELFVGADIDVRSQENVEAYLTVLKRIGKVKGFTVSRDSENDVNRYSLEGNSNGVLFTIYDLAGVYLSRLKEATSGRKYLKELIKDSVGLLRTEVRLTEAKTIQAYTNGTTTTKQIVNIMDNCEAIFGDTLSHVVPFGDFYKKKEVIERLYKEVKDVRLRRRMIALVERIPSKRSLWLGQKTISSRRLKQVMEMFAMMEVSPVTISKRQDVKKLKNIYRYM